MALISKWWWISPLARYVYRQQRQRSRYEIDVELLGKGYDPAKIEAVWQLLNPTSKTALNEAWWVLGNPLAKSQFTQPLPKKLSRLYLISIGVAIYSLFLPVWLVGFWPLVFFSPLIGLWSLYFNLLVLVGWLWQDWLRRRAQYAKSYILMIAIVISLLAIPVSVLIMGSEPQKEVATLNIKGHDYHLLYHAGCIDTCSEGFSLYRCDFFNLVCSNTSFFRRELDHYSQATPVTAIRLVYDSANASLNVLNDDQLICTFNS